MKKQIVYIIFGIFLCFIFQEKVFAQDCEYEYIYIIDLEGEVDTSATAYNGQTVTFSDGKVSDSSLENWSSNNCPAYVVSTEEVGFFPWDIEKKYYGYDVGVNWDDSGTEEMRKDGGYPKKVFQRKGLEEENPKITCEYDNGVKLLIDATTHSVGASSSKDNLVMYYHYSVSGTLNDEWFESDGSIGKCLPVTVCFDKTDIPFGNNPVTHNWYTVYIDDLQVPSGKYSNGDCKRASYAGNNSDYKVDDSQYSCTTYANKIKKIDLLYQQLSNAKGNSKASIASQVNQEEAKLSTLCKAAFNTFTYESDCVRDCTGLETDIANIKDKYNINSAASANAKCKLSERLVTWIMKIINWMRYIVPVLLILLSILDYIKAIAADSEDEVKKVTSKFVKRLIVAVVIFLVPLALQFLLGIFGIDANNFCL